MAKVERIGFIETGSEIEALILEAQLIKKLMPKFNVVWRDDKNHFYVAIVYNKNGLPYVFITHQINKSKIFWTRKDSPQVHHKSKIRYIGPFVEGNALKKTLKFLRRVFPFYTLSTHPKGQCPWCHLDLCPGPELFENPPSPEAFEGLREYKKNIQKLVLILQGKRKNALYALRKEMQNMSKEHKFEEAGKIRDKINSLQQIMAHRGVIGSFKNEGDNWDKTKKLLQDILSIKTSINRIECYDISNIQGKQAVGSMVVFTNGEPDKSQYKKFRIRGENSSPTNFGTNVVKNKKLGREINSPKLVGGKPNDIAMLQEIITRRLYHSEWPYPEAMLIDGGIAQINIAIKVKNKRPETKGIKVISIAKRYKELYIEGKKEPILLKTVPQTIYNLIIHLDDEAHRFAITYHRKLRKKNLLR